MVCPLLVQSGEVQLSCFPGLAAAWTLSLPALCSPSTTLTEGSSSCPFPERGVSSCSSRGLASPRASSPGISSGLWLQLLPGHQGVSNSHLRPSPAVLQLRRAKHLLGVSSGTCQGHPRPATCKTEPPVSLPEPGAPLEPVVSAEAPQSAQNRDSIWMPPLSPQLAFLSSCGLHSHPSFIQPAPSTPAQSRPHPSGHPQPVGVLQLPWPQ